MDIGRRNIVNGKGGFTIVELLIVIVVIAILASITVVAFNGLQNRAQNAKIAAAVDAYKKGFELYYVANGQYPTHPYVSCLGSVKDFPAKDGFGEGVCTYTTGGTSFTYEVDENVNNELMKFISTTPDVTTGKVTDTFVGSSLTYNMRGIAYESHPDWVYMDYHIPRSMECAPGTESSDVGTSSRRCVIEMYSHL